MAIDDSSLEDGMSKTLHSGLRVLEILSEQPDGLTITQVSEAVGVHRTVAHRLLRTLEAHRLVRRDRAKRFHPGSGLVPLAEPVDRDLRSISQPLLAELADRAGATAHLVVQEDDEHVRALLVIEPRRASVHIAFRPGQLDRITVGSAGMAILAAQPPRDGERAEITNARERGYTVSFSEVIPSVYGISAVVPTQSEPRLAIGISLFELTNESELAELVTSTAHRLDAALS